MNIMNKSLVATSTKSITLRRLHQLLRRLSGYGYIDEEDRNRAIQEMQESQPGKLFALLIQLLKHRNLNVRCHAAESILRLDKARGVEAVLPFIQDRSKTLRWQICGLLHDFGDSRAVPALIERLKMDPDPQIRNTAAYALGGIGSFQALHALVEAKQNDHEVDMHGHSASSVSTSAISDILMKESIRIVETYPDTEVRVEREPNTLIRAVITLQSIGQQYQQLPWQAWGPTTGWFDPPLSPLHVSPFTVDMCVTQEEKLCIRRVFIFQGSETSWSISTVVKPDLQS